LRVFKQKTGGLLQVVTFLGGLGLLSMGFASALLYFETACGLLSTSAIFMNRIFPALILRYRRIRAPTNNTRLYLQVLVRLVILFTQ